MCVHGWVLLFSSMTSVIEYRSYYRQNVVPLNQLCDKLFNIKFPNKQFKEYVYDNFYLIESKHHMVIYEALINKAVNNKLLDKNTRQIIRTLEQDKPINEARKNENSPPTYVLNQLVNILWKRFKLNIIFLNLKEHRDIVKNIYRYLKVFIPEEDRPFQEQINKHDLDKYGMKELIAQCLHSIHRFHAPGFCGIKQHRKNAKHHIEYWIHEKHEEIPKNFMYELLVDEMSHRVVKNEFFKRQRLKVDGKTTMKQLLQSVNIEKDFSNLNVFNYIKTTIRNCQIDCRKNPLKYEKQIIYCEF